MCLSSSYDHFLRIHKAQLETTGVPERYWEALHEKLQYQLFDIYSVVTVLRVEFLVPALEGEMEHDPSWVVQAKRDIRTDDFTNIYLIDHAWAGRIANSSFSLVRSPELRDRINRIIGFWEGPLENDADDAERILKYIWKYMRYYCIGSNRQPEGKIPIWYLMDEVGSGVMHSNTPNCRIVPFIDVASQEAYSLIFPIVDIPLGEFMTRDCVEGAPPDKRHAWAVPWITPIWEQLQPEIVDPVDEAYFLSGHIGETVPPVERLISRFEYPLKVYTEFDDIIPALSNPLFKLTALCDEADVLWYMGNFRDFELLPAHKLINQFPYENVITLKDLLHLMWKHEPDFSKKYHPLTYNLTTELNAFLLEFNRRKTENEHNIWILKPFNLARSLDITICDNLHFISRVLTTPIPKLAQLYVSRPVLYYRDDINADVKFDLQYIVCVKSLGNPHEIYLYRNFFLRLGSMAFKMRYFDVHPIHFTTMNYMHAGRIVQLMCADFKNSWNSMYPEQEWSTKIEPEIITMVQSLFECSTRAQPPCGIAPNPQSRAIYAVDILLEWEDEEHTSIQPKLLEVNWALDCSIARNFYPDFYNNVFELLFCENVSEGVMQHFIRV